MSEIIKYRGYMISIEQDIDPLSPREWDNVGTMACEHARYSLGDGELALLYDALSKHPSWQKCWEDTRSEHYKEADDLEWLEKTADRFGFVLLSLFLYDHSGITMRTTPFSCPWDSGQVGVIFASPARIRGEWGLRPGPRISERIKKRVSETLKGEVDTYDHYLRGDVWGFIIKDSQGEEVDSCWGWFGKANCEAEAKAVVDQTITSTPEQLELNLPSIKEE